MAQPKNKNTVPENHPLMKSPIGISFKHLSNSKALNHAFMQHDWHMSQKQAQSMASGGMPRDQFSQPSPDSNNRGAVQEPPGGLAPRPANVRAQPNRVNYPTGGPIAVNPKTGERLRHDGSKWVPA